MLLNKAQQEAVEYLDGPLLVLAGPGTGKTQLLSAKVKYILENTDATPENILCITFTESGASNMRERLTSMIGRAAGQINIHTYHAFGSDILAQYRHYNSEFSRPLTEPISTVAQYKIIQTIQKSLPATDILRGDKISDIIETIASSKSARLTADDLKTIAEFNKQQSAELSSDANLVLKNLIPRMKYADAMEKVYLPLCEVLSNYTSNKPLARGIEPTANILLRELNNLIETENSAEKPSVAPFTKWKNGRFELDDKGNYRLKDIVSNKKLASLSKIMQAYNEYLAENGLFDFSDMIELAIKTLQKDEGFRLTLAERYQYILLDEFQDTNPSQFELIHLIAKTTEKPCIMAVGDDDQAIFEFQGANASNMLDFQNLYHAKIITLTENYRSTQEILDFSRHIADQIEDSFAKHHNIKKRLIATQETSPENTLISRHEFISADAEYAWIAKEIATLVENGVNQSDIAIITPKHKYIAPLLPYLKSYKNIYITYEKRENVLEDEKIHQLITISRFIHEYAEMKNPARFLMEILSYPFWEIPPLSVIEAFEKAQDRKKSALDYLLKSEDEKLKTVGDFLAHLVMLSYDTPLELMFDYMTGATSIEKLNFCSPFLSYYAKENSYDTLNLYENLNVLRTNIREYSGQKKLKLADFISFLDDYELAGEAILNTSPYQDNENSVQILTAHKSKGLEFKYVFLPSVDNLSWGKAKGNNNTLSLPLNLAVIRHTGITDDERLRLLFVAITRAKTNLILTSSAKDFSGKSPDCLAYLDEHIDQTTNQPVSPFLPNPIINLHNQDISAEDIKQNLELDWSSAYTKITPQLRPLLEKRLENYRLTASALTKFIDIAYAGPLVLYRTDILKAPMEPASPQISFGNLIHSTFENITNQHLTDDEAISFFRSQVELQPVSEEDQADLLERGLDNLNVSLKTFGQLLRDPRGQAEVDFWHENLILHTELGDVPITGKIDHLTVDEETKTIEIYDFKTSGYTDKKWTAHATLYKYALQLGFYKLLLNLSPTYSKYKVKQAHILFVSPDQADHKVHDKIYEYNDTDEANLKLLMAAVFRHIKTLDFLENPELAVNPDSSNNLKQIKEFVAKVIDIFN